MSTEDLQKEIGPRWTYVDSGPDLGWGLVALLCVLGLAVFGRCILMMGGKP